MKLLACLMTLFALLLVLASANTDKTIFVAPQHIKQPESGPSLSALYLSTLSPTRTSLRASLPVAFASQDNPSGLQSWYLLQGLQAGQRYEVRICWAATQPTTFDLTTYNITHVFDTPDLIQRLASYADTRTADIDVLDITESGTNTLLLHITAAADFFSTNATLMRNPPDVDVDIILDPYIFNVFPRSLGGTAAYIVILAIGSWYLSAAIWKRLSIAEGKERSE